MPLATVTKNKPNMLTISAWTLWSILIVVLLIGMVMVSTEKSYSPEVSHGMGTLVIGMLLFFLICVGGLIYWFVQRQNQIGLIAVVLMLSWPVVFLIMGPAVTFYKKWSMEQKQKLIGDFNHPVLNQISNAIREKNDTKLKQLLSAQPLTNFLDFKDRAGNDLLAFALQEMRDHQGSVNCIRMLLEAKVDPKKSRISNGQDPLNFIILGSTTEGRDVFFLLLKYGADVNAVDPITGETPIQKAGSHPDIVKALVEAGADMDRIQPNGVTALVDFVAQREWDSAIYLVEKGARLDVSNDSGISLDYYLKEWKDDVYGDQPEGWEKLKKAIAKRQETPKP